MRAALRSRGMALIAYCPIALGRVVGDPAIEAIAAAHGRSAAQVDAALAGAAGRTSSRSRKTSKVERLAENLAVFDFALERRARWRG